MSERGQKILSLDKYHTFLETGDDGVNVKELARKLEVETAGSQEAPTAGAEPR